MEENTEGLEVNTKVETEEICPIMSSQGFSPVRCRKDCAWFRHTEGACAIHVISSRRR